MDKPIKIFYSYSHKDEDLRKELDDHLSLLRKQGYIREWNDRIITAGSEWKNDISKNLSNSDIILLLVSSYFLASDYCVDIEMTTALKMHSEGTAIVIPIILRDCDWQGASFSNLKALPTDGKAITGRYWNNMHEAFTVVSKELKKKIEEIRAIEKSDIKNYIAEKTLPQVIYKNYPPPKPYFVGRENELKRLHDAYGSPFILIEGPGGIGKTQLVAKFIEQLDNKDRIIWYQCNPTSQPDDLIRGSGFGELLKGENKSELEKYSAFKDKIEEYELAIFLDNYQDVASNHNFISFLNFIDNYLKEGHLIIISRDNIVSANLKPRAIHVSGMGASSVEHARNIIKHSYDGLLVDDNILDNVCQKLQGYPLAVELAIELLSQNVAPNRIIDVAGLEFRDGNNEDVSKRLLNEIFTRPDASENEKTFLKLLSVYRGKVQEDAAKIIIPSEIFEVTNRKLLKRNLLSNEDGFLELHPLIREFCYEKLESKTEIQFKAANFFMNQRSQALDLILEEKIFYHLSSARKWSEISEIIIEFGREFIIRGYVDSLYQMIRVVKENDIREDFFYVLEGDILEQKSDWNKSLATFEKGMHSEKEKIAIECKIKYGEILFRQGNVKQSANIFLEVSNLTVDTEFENWYARALNNRGLVEFYFGNPRAALQYLNEALSIRQSLNERVDVATTMHNIGVIKIKLGEKQDALNMYRAALVIQEEIDEKVGIARSYFNIGKILFLLGEKANGEPLLIKSLKIYQLIGDKVGIASCFNGMGSMQRTAGNLREASILYNRSLDIQVEIDNKIGIASGYNFLGGLEIDRRQYDDAVIYFNRAMALYEEMGYVSGIAETLSNLGVAKSYLNKGKEATDYITKSLRFFQDLDYKEGISSSYNTLARLNSVLGNNDIAFDYYYEALKINIEIEDKFNTASVYNNLGNLKSENNKNEALDLYLKALKLKEELGDIPGMHTALINIGRLYIELKNYSQACVSLLKAFAFCKKMSVPTDQVLAAIHQLKTSVKGQSSNDIFTHSYNQLEDDLREMFSLSELISAPQKSRKVGRNMPCPCGSDKKYKQCHGKSA